MNAPHPQAQQLAEAHDKAQAERFDPPAPHHRSHPHMNTIRILAASIALAALAALTACGGGGSDDEVDERRPTPEVKACTPSPSDTATPVECIRPRSQL